MMLHHLHLAMARIQLASVAVTGTYCIDKLKKTTQHTTSFKNTMHNYIYILIHIVRTNTNEDSCIINVICVWLLMVVSNTVPVLFFCVQCTFLLIVHLLIALSVVSNVYLSVFSNVY